MSHTLFISDLHLSADHPNTMAAFLHFTATIAPQSEALYILGDLFEYWAGDDDMYDPFHQKIILALHSLSVQRTRVFIMHGNRDLLMGEALATACGASLLPDPTRVNLYGTPTLLSHGDILCTDDVEYQNFRKQVHEGEFQREFLAKPLTERRAYLDQLRQLSNQQKLGKAAAIMDVNQDAIACLLREYRYARLIHGHTHRQNRHEHLIDGHLCERWVLGDWDTHANALRVASTQPPGFIRLS